MFIEVTPTAGLTADLGDPTLATDGVEMRPGSPERGTLREYNSCMVLAELTGP